MSLNRNIKSFKYNQQLNKKISYQNSRRVNTYGSGTASIVIDNEIELEPNQNDNTFEKLNLSIMAFNDDEMLRMKNFYKYYKIEKLMIQCLPSDTNGKISWYVADDRNVIMDSDSAKEIYYPFFKTRNYYFRLPNILSKGQQNDYIFKPMGWNITETTGSLGYILFRNTCEIDLTVRIRLLIRFRGYHIETNHPTKYIEKEDKFKEFANVKIKRKGGHSSNMKREVEVTTDNQALSINIPSDKFLACLQKFITKKKSDKPQLTNVDLLYEWKIYINENDINPINVSKQQIKDFITKTKKNYYIDETSIETRIQKILNGEKFQYQSRIRKANAMDLIELAVENKFLDAIKDWDIIKEAGYTVDIHEVDGEKIVVVDDGEECDEDEDEDKGDKILEEPKLEITAYDPNDV